jgi:hypothetical protein
MVSAKYAAPAKVRGFLLSYTEQNNEPAVLGSLIKPT